MSQTDSEKIRETVREGYARIAQGEILIQSPAQVGPCCAESAHAASGCCSGEAPAKATSCCGGDEPAVAHELARAVGYDLEDLQALPEGANMGLSCGNPVALATLKPGEVVVDLGSGGGFDVFIAGRRVGPTGRAIGIDMTPEMLSKARRNTAVYRESTGLDNAEFRLGEIEHLPLADASVDCIISNCVINLSPDKPQVWREIARVLKPGGRVAVSDIVLLKPLPDVVRAQVQALVGCVAGAVLMYETEAMARDAGLIDVQLTRKDDYVQALTDWRDPLDQQIAAALPPGMSVGDYVTSLEVTAFQPRAGSGCCTSC